MNSLTKTRVCSQTARIVRICTSRPGGVGRELSGTDGSSETIDPTKITKYRVPSENEPKSACISIAPQPCECTTSENDVRKDIVSGVIMDTSSALQGTMNLKAFDFANQIKLYMDSQMNYHKMQIKLNKSAMRRIKKLAKDLP